MGCLIAFRLCRSRVLALAVALLAFFVSQGWAACETGDFVGQSFDDFRCYWGQNCDSSTAGSRCSEHSGCTSCPETYHSANSQYYYAQKELSGYCTNSVSCAYSCCLKANAIISCYYGLRCSSKLEADSVNCVNGGNKWNSLTSRCEKDCKNRACCDSVAQNSPVKTDTTWEGCIPAGPIVNGNEGCQVYNVGVTPGDTTVSATCDGISQYRVCTEQYMWSESAKQCAPIMTNNCATFTQRDSMCTDVKCYATQQHALSSLDYDHLTQCYSGTETVQKILICDNGIREDGGSYTRPWKVCQPYLDSIGSDISDYIAGRSGYSGTGYSAGGGSSVGGGGSGGGGSDPNYGGCVGNGCGTEDGMAPGYQGGPGVDAQGNEVENSPSPGIGGQYTPTPQIVTEYDSTTGKIEIVKNSSGGDSIVVNNVFSKIRCLGVSNGIATLTNGLNTWSCEAQSCSQATLSASINQGQCSPLANGVTRSETNPSVPTINYGSSSSNVDWNSNEYEMLEQGLAMVTATLNAINADQKRHNDSLYNAEKNELWKVTFGNDLSYVESIKNSAESAAGSISNGFNNTILAVSNGTDNVVSAVQNASSNVSGAVTSAGNDIETAVNRVRQSVDQMDANAAGRATNLRYDIAAVQTTIRDSVHNTNSMLEVVESAVSDTGRKIPTVLKSIDSQLDDLPSRLDSVFTVDMESWSNDKLKIMMDSNTVKVVDALDNLNVDVQLDSIRVQVPHDTVLDSIRSDLKARGDFSLQQKPDTVDFGKIFQQGFDSAKGDTSFAVDSSFSKLISSVYYVDGGDFSDDTNVDSLTSEINRKLDSSNVAHNARSDSLTGAYVDTMMKYSGLSTGAPAVQQFFAQGGNDACPRNCLDLSLTHPFVSGAQPTRIQFSTYLCDLKIFANYSVLDFIKLILRLMTSLLCLMFIWSSVGKRGDGK